MSDLAFDDGWRNDSGRCDCGARAVTLSPMMCGSCAGHEPPELKLTLDRACCDCERQDRLQLCSECGRYCCFPCSERHYLREWVARG
jgi:hypothetical protein